ncbi:kinase-like domain-containing protein [Radiomyces spectabilis]|uniref:kinase-like domain-containing protein n=1 Tax=Radiomyces spectabilis TaxID=64574 RepID=UPI00221FD091|nr:kinase-like domain-containing protein [Radiomyces spectabilis]KAI8378066.1 kinase-like domain-containing protein [Radiomyces spectabilis]
MATSYASLSRLARSKSGADILVDKMRLEQVQQDERQAVHFLNNYLNLSLKDGQLHKALNDGVILCNLVNKIKPGTIKHVGQKDLSFIKMDNITRFLQGARQLGVSDTQLFETIDLFEGKDMVAVIHTILSLAQICVKQNLMDSDTLIQSETNERKTDDEKEGNGNNDSESKRGILQPSEVDEDKETNTVTNENEISLHNGNEDGTSHDEDSTHFSEPIPPSLDVDPETSTSYGEEDEGSDGYRQETTTPYRDVRDIFVGIDTNFSPTPSISTLHRDSSRMSTFSPLQRPPKSPLRTCSKTNSFYHTSSSLKSRRSHLDDVRQKRLSSPSVTTGKKSGYPCSGATMSRSNSSSSCSSVLSSASSSSSPQTPRTPTSLSSKTGLKMDPAQVVRQSSTHSHHSRRAERRRQSVTFPPQKKHGHEHGDPLPASGSASVGRKLERHLAEAIQQDDKSRERLLLRSKDGSNSAQYQLGNCIGKGQFGSVYRALDLATGEIVAVKRVKLEDGELDKEIMKEVSLLKNLSHQNVIQYLGFIRSKHHMNIVLEYAENGSLMSTLKAFGAFPEKLVASFAIKILSGLEYLHVNQVVHCDLKAANILTTKTGDVKLTDFGVSLNLKIKGADAGTVSGTPNWMAPEVIELNGASPKSDIWSLGCTLVELATGKPPYGDLIAMSAMFRIVEDDYPPLPNNVSAEMHSFLLCCFQKNPDERPSASQLKKHIWIQKNQQAKKVDSYSRNLSNHLHSASSSHVHLPMSSTQFLSSATSPSSSHHRHHKRHSSTEYDRQSVPYPSMHRRSYVLPEENVSFHRPISGLAEEEDYITHRFIHTSFGKTVECKVCGELTKLEIIFCEVCALICHEECKKAAFSCPPKVNDQQPSYDWVFSAKIYNRSQNRKGTQENFLRTCEIPTNRTSHIMMPSESQVEDIRKYSQALGLTPQEELALSQNPALLSHTLALQQSMKAQRTSAQYRG